MMPQNAAIWFCFGIAALSTLLMIFQKDSIKAAVLMLTVLLSTAGIYLALSAQFLSALQVILYAGAVMTLFTVALTVAPRAWRDRPKSGKIARLLGLAVPAVILIELLKLAPALVSARGTPVFAETGTLSIAGELLGHFVFQFELLSLVLLAAVIGAVTLAAKRRPSP